MNTVSSPGPPILKGIDLFVIGLEKFNKNDQRKGGVFI